MQAQSCDFSVETCTMSYGPAPTTSGIIGNLTGGAVCLTGNVTVNSNWTLIDEDLIISSGVTITVLNGFTMTIQNNSEFYAASTTWVGIVVEAGGHLIMNNSRIKDAEIAIKAINSGGIESKIDVTESCLLNNEIGIYCTGSLTTPSNSTIIDNDISAPSLPVSGLIGDYGILIDGVYVDGTSPNAIFIGNTLAYPGGGTNNDIHDYAIGIRAYNSNVTVQNNLVRDIHSTGFDLSNSPLPYGESYLGGRIGILSTSTLNPPRQVRLQVGISPPTLNNEIVDVRDGIIADLNVNTLLYNNSLKSNSSTTPAMRNGIQLLNKSSSNIVQSNSIINFRRQGINCSNINAGILTILDNTITNGVDANSIGINVVDAVFTTLHTVNIISNNITQIVTGIKTLNFTNGTIQLNHIEFEENPLATIAFGIYAQDCPGIQILSNYTGGDCNTPSCSIQRIGILVSDCANDMLLDKNYMFNCYIAAGIENNNMGGNLTCNEIHECYYGYGLKNVVVDGTPGEDLGVGFPAAIERNVGAFLHQPSDNSWYNASTANREKNFVGTDVHALYWRYRSTPAAYDMPLSLIYPMPYGGFAISPFLVSSPSIDICSSNAPLKITDDSLLIALANLELKYAGLTVETDVEFTTGLYYAYWFLYGDVNAMEGLSDILTDDLNALYSSIESSNIPAYYHLNDSMATGSYESAAEMLSLITPANIVEEYMSITSNIYLNSLDTNGRLQLSDDNRIILEDIITYPYKEYGFGVHIAQALLDTMITESYDLEEGYDERLSQSKTINIYPNPAQSELFFQTNFDFNGDLTIYNMEGNPVIQSKGINQDSSVNISFLPSGVYFIKLIQEGETIFIDKLIINQN